LKTKKLGIIIYKQIYMMGFQALDFADFLPFPDTEVAGEGVTTGAAATGAAATTGAAGFEPD